jgi:hypothetical protein
MVPDKGGDILDWVNLPKGAHTESLWASLHDAEIVSIQSNLLERTVVLGLEASHLCKFHDLPTDLQFSFRLTGVQSARVVRYVCWPGELKIPRGASREEESHLVAAYQDKCREESVSWTQFQTSISQDKHMVLEISSATLASGEGKQFALGLSAHDSYNVCYELFLRADGLNVLRSDGEPLGLGQFKRLGEAYWDAFSSRKK